MRILFMVGPVVFIVRLLCRMILLGRTIQREGELKSTSLTQLALQGKATPVKLNQLSGNWKSEAGAFPRSLRGRADLVELLKNVCLLFWRDSDSSIAYRDLQPAVLRYGVHPNTPVFRREFNCVGEQV